MRDILAMLKDSGSRMITQRNHYKYELPNGRLFTCPKTPSDYRGIKNCLTALRKELRQTHPAIADRGRNVKKARLTTTIGDLLQSKTISPFTAVPGSEPSPAKEIEFEIIPKAIEVQAEEPQTLIPSTPRKLRAEPKPKPTSYRTLTPEQMEEANRLLHSEGNVAMNTFLSQCKTEELPVERKRHIPIPVTTNEGDPMTELLERARAELTATNVRLEEYEQQFVALKTKQDQDVLKQTQLEQFIAKHESLAAEAAELLPLLPAKAEPKPQAKKRAIVPGQTCGYGIGILRERVFPRLTNKEFRAEDVLRIAQELPLAGPHPSRSQLHTWLLAEAGRKKGVPTIERTSNPGWFRCNPMTFLPPAVPVSQVAHA